MNLSVVVPLLNEADSLPELHARIQKICAENQLSYEIIFIDDGSTDDSWNVISALQNQDSNVKGIQFRRNYGKSQALHAAFKKAAGEIIVTMDADLQDFPEEIPNLIAKIKEGNDLVSGWKKKRYDNVLTKNLPSKLYNFAARKTSGVTLNDFNCGLKAYKKDVVKNIEVNGEMHRYIPVLAKNAGFDKIVEIQVPHQARLHGESKFGKSRFIRGFLDLISLWFLSKFGSRPMHFFGALGTFMFIFGFLSALYLGLDKLYLTYIVQSKAKLVTDNPFFYIALTLMVLGTQLFIAGFMGEMLLKTNPKKKNYKISEYLNLSK